MGKPVKIKFKNKATGKMEVVNCHDPETCREHAWLVQNSSGNRKHLFKGVNVDDLEASATVEDESNITIDDYYHDSIVDDLYEAYTIEVVNPVPNPAMPYLYTPKDTAPTCRECGNELERRDMKWNNDTFANHGTVWVHKDNHELDFFDIKMLNKNLHIEATGELGNKPTGDRHYPHPTPWCLRCGTVGSISNYSDAWADYEKCNAEGCGYEQRYSLGD